MNYRDLGYTNFLQRSILQNTNRQSSIETKNQLPIASIPASSIIPPLNPTTDIVFSSVDNDTAEWTAGKVYFSNGSDSGQIEAGSTGDIGQTTYIYLDREQPGALQTTTNAAQATGLTRLLIAIIELGAVGKSCKITPIIAAGLTVTSITAQQIDVDQLAALAINTGSLVVDEVIDVGSGGTGYVKIDGVNKRIIVNDGATNRIVIGNI